MRRTSGANSTCSLRKRSATSVPGLDRRRLDAGAERPQRVQDGGDVDHLLQEGTDRRREGAGRAHPHEHERQPHTEQDALDRDPTRALRDRHGVDQSIESVHDQHDVGGLGGRGRAARPHRHTHIRGGEGRRIVQTVADHHDDPLGALGRDGLDLLVGGALGQDPVDTERRTDGLGHVRVIAGDHDHAPDARTAQRTDHAGRVGADRVIDHQRAGHLAVDAHEHARGAVQHRAAAHVARAGRQRPAARHERGLPECDLSSLDDPGDARPDSVRPRRRGT